MRCERLAHLGEVAIAHLGQPVGGESDPVVRDAVLREVVGADFLGPLAGPDLSLPFLRDFVVLALEFYLIETRA